MNTIIRSIAVLFVAFALAACGSSSPTVAPSSLAASPSTAVVIPSPSPVASPKASATPTASCDPAFYDPTYPGPGCGPKSSYDMSKCDPRWYPTANVFASDCGTPDLSKCDPSLIFSSLCVVPGPLPADWTLTDQSAGGKTMWGASYNGSSLSWNPPTAVFCVSGPLLQIQFVRRDGIGPNVKAAIAGGIANFAQSGWLPTGTKQTGSGNLTLGPWVGQYASYSCPGGTTTVTLFAANDGSSNTMINAVSSTQADNEKSVSDFIAAFSLQAGTN